MLRFFIAQKILQDAILVTNEVQHKQLKTCKNNTQSLDFFLLFRKEPPTPLTSQAVQHVNCIEACGIILPSKLDMLHPSNPWSFSITVLLD